MLIELFQIRCYIRFQFHLFFGMCMFFFLLHVSFCLILISWKPGQQQLKSIFKMSFLSNYGFVVHFFFSSPKQLHQICIGECSANKCLVAGAFVLTSGSVIIMSLLPIVYSFIVVVVHFCFVFLFHLSYHMFNYVSCKKQQQKNWTRLDRFKMKTTFTKKYKKKLHFNSTCASNLKKMNTSYVLHSNKRRE